jgi:biopolymer transport protein ExbD
MPSYRKLTIMAEVQTTASTGRRGVTKGKKLSTRVDLTPMVDLGFLLITFFIFTTTLSEQKTMKLNLPKDATKNLSTTPESKTISLLLCKNNKVKYYMGNNPAIMQETNYSPSGIRNVILQQEQTVASRFGNRSETVVLIKTTEDCTYENIVNTLDEMTINDVHRYVLMDANKEELSFIKQ